ncbi:MAG: hypothetical protein WA984_06680 [Phormidesmis sp.]
MTHSTARDRHQLETLWQLPTTESCSREPRLKDSKLSQLFAQTAQMGRVLVVFLTGQQQLRIWSKSTQQGTVWFAYDPASGQQIARCSEAALRLWLESRHLQ